MKFRRQLAVVILALAGTSSVAFADAIIQFPYYPALSGFGGCCGSGDLIYDAESGGFLQVLSEDFDVWHKHDPWEVEGVQINNVEVVASGIVLGNRNVLSGSFAIFGAIPELGLVEQTLLVSGSMVDVYYGWYADGGGRSAAVQLLFKSDYAHSSVRDRVGRYGVWMNYVEDVGAWYDPDNDEYLAFCCDYVQAREDHWTNDSMFFYRRNPLPEPGTLALLAIGLAGMGLSRRRTGIISS